MLAFQWKIRKVCSPSSGYVESLTMINTSEALRLILEVVPAAKSEKIKLAGLLGRTLAEDLIAQENLPPFPNSSMDGYAVRVSDLSQASTEKPVVLTVAGEASAGSVFRKKLPPLSVVRIMTGGLLPQGADAVVPLEQCTQRGERKIVFVRTPKGSEYVRFPGEDVALGETVMTAGDVITPAHLGVLASLGSTKVNVARRPRVAIVATGDELVDATEKPTKGQIRNSSSEVLTGLVHEAGGTPAFLGIARDDQKRIKKLLKEGLRGDYLLVSGGVSMGKYDLVKEVLEDLGTAIKFWKVNIRPGKPLLFGTCKKTLVFGLPGNPVSTTVTFIQFVRPALRKMLGRKEIFPHRFAAVCDESLKKNDGKRHFLRGVTRWEDGRIHVRTTGSQSSGALSSLVKADCLIILPEEATEVQRGDEVRIEYLRNPS